jgi:glucose/mannose-6-phosphate isomerase
MRRENLHANKTVDIDKPNTYLNLDSEDMLKKLNEFPSLCRQAWDLAMHMDLPPVFTGIDKVVILGMGGSAIGGDLVSSLALAESHVPITVCRGYDLPAYVNDRTLVIANSYSGNTEETLSCFEQSIKSRAKILVMTTGGKLKARADSLGIPVFTYNYKSQPRAALPFSFMPLLCFMQKLRLVREISAEVNEMIDTLWQQQENYRAGMPLVRNEAKKLASELRGSLAVIYGAETVSEVAHRWKTQINENSKTWAFYEVIPELNHNSIVGYEFPSDFSNRVFVVMLSSSFLSPRVQIRYDVVGRLLNKAGVKFKTVSVSSSNRLSEMTSLILLGDYVSYYLALLNGVDPTPIPTIDYLKEELSKK